MDSAATYGRMGQEWPKRLQWEVRRKGSEQLCIPALHHSLHALDFLSSSADPPAARPGQGSPQLAITECRRRRLRLMVGLLTGSFQSIRLVFRGAGTVLVR